MVREGRKLRFHYHKSCFKGSGDPRTQPCKNIVLTLRINIY
jgi:hypothetical protein